MQPKQNYEHAHPYSIRAQPRAADLTQRTQPGFGGPQPPAQRLWPRLALSRWAAVELAAFLGLYANARADSTVVAWGENSSGQTNVPPDLTNVMTVAAGGNHNLALIGGSPLQGRSEIRL